MPSNKLSPFEEKRVSDILQAAFSGAWPDFKELTDEPFSNELSMREQFEDSSKRMRELRGRAAIKAGVDLQEDGTRLIIVRINDGRNKGVILTIHSTEESNYSHISIWSFYVEIDISSL